MTKYPAPTKMFSFLLVLFLLEANIFFSFVPQIILCSPSVFGPIFCLFAKYWLQNSNGQNFTRITAESTQLTLSNFILQSKPCRQCHYWDVHIDASAPAGRKNNWMCSLLATDGSLLGLPLWYISIYTKADTFYTLEKKKRCPLPPTHFMATLIWHVNQSYWKKILPICESYWTWLDDVG